MADVIPAGFAQRKSGLLVKSELALEATANSQFTWQPTGLDDPEKRGQDRADFRYERLSKEIETSRRRDPLIFRGVDYYDKLGIGIGIELSSEQDGILQAAEAVWEVNDLDDVQHQASNELVTTGNLFFRVPEKYDGLVPQVQLIPNAQIERIATKDGRPWYYRRKWQDLEYPEPRQGVQDGRGAIAPKTRIRYEDIPAAEIVHVAINRTAGELRGTSMLEPSVYWTALYGRSLETVWATAVARSLIAYHCQIDAANSDDLDKLITLIQNQLVTRTDPRGQQYKSMATGQILATSKGVELKRMDSAVSAGSLDTELRRILLMGAVGMGTPEFVLSDGENANRATTESQSDPYFRMMQAHQHVIIKAFRRVYIKVFDRLTAAGQFDGLKAPEGKTHIADWLKLSAPNLLTPDVETLGPVAAQLVQGGIWSRQYANEQLGADWTAMQKQIKDEKELGFASEPVAPQPGITLPPSSRAIQQNLPFAQLDVDGDRAETETPTQRKQRILRETLNGFIAEAKAAKGDKGKIEQAAAKWLAEARQEVFDLIDQARNVGAQSVAA